MAHIMKISVVKLNGENVIIPLIQSETLEEFRARAFKDYSLEFDNDHFSNMFLDLSPQHNLYTYLNSQTNLIADNHKADEETDFIYEIHMNANDVQNSTVPFEIGANESPPENNDTTVATATTTFTVTNLHVIGMNGTEPNAELADIFEIQQNPDVQQLMDIDEKKSDEPLPKDHEKLGESGAEVSLGNEHASETEKNYSYLDIESKLREMHESNEKASDFCRLCAKSVADATNVAIYSTGQDYGEQINGTLPIAVKPEDGLPQQMCEECAALVRQYCEFVQTVVRADRTLRSKFTDVSKASPATSSEQLMSELLGSEEAGGPADSPDMCTEYLCAEGGDGRPDPPRCRMCDLILDDAAALQRHCTDAHLVDGLTACALCPYGFQSAEQLAEHVVAEHSAAFELRRRRPLPQKPPPAPTNRSLHCEVCSRAFPTKVRLNFHRQFHLKRARPLVCTICDLSLEDENEYFDHVNFVHDSRKVYACDVCDKTFGARAALNSHRRTHAARNHRCHVCGKCFADRQTLREHEAGHTDGHTDARPFQCHKCGKNLNRLSRLKQHLLTHDSNPVVNDVHVCTRTDEAFGDERSAREHQPLHGDCVQVFSTDRVFRCEFCEKCYIAPEALNTHRALHKGPTPFSCHICKAQFSTYSRCTTHKTTHGLFKDGADKDPFPVVKHFLCEHCGKSYLHWSYLGLHRRLKHSSSAPVHKCHDCNVQFPTSAAVAHHRKTKHQEQYKCGDCGKCMSSLQVLRAHQQTVHVARRQKDLQCDKCGKVFVQQQTLEAHMRLHQEGVREYRCSYCSKAFFHPAGLSNHIKQHKERQFGCAHCDKRFSTRAECAEHEALHAVKRRFSCDVCSKAFDSRALLASHGKLHEERPFTCDVCGLSFRRSFTLRSHKNKHKKQSGSFVLMVDMKEDNFDNAEAKEPTNPNDFVQTIMDESQAADGAFVELGAAAAELPGNYIDLGNGNYLPIQGNTISIGGKQYFLINEQPKPEEPAAAAPHIQMLVDDPGGEVQPLGAPPDDQYGNGAVMLVDDGSIILNQDQVQPEYVFTTADATLKANAAFIVGNQLMLDAEEQTF